MQLTDSHRHAQEALTVADDRCVNTVNFDVRVSDGTSSTQDQERYPRPASDAIERPSGLYPV